MRIDKKNRFRSNIWDPYFAWNAIAKRTGSGWDTDLRTCVSDSNRCRDAGWTERRTSLYQPGWWNTNASCDHTTPSNTRHYGDARTDDDTLVTSRRCMSAARRRRGWSECDRCTSGNLRLRRLEKNKRGWGLIASLSHFVTNMDGWQEIIPVWCVPTAHPLYQLHH